MGIEKKITEMLVTASCGDQKQIAETIAKEMGLVLDGRPITISFKMSIFDEVVDVETAHATIECLVDWINHRLESKNWKHDMETLCTIRDVEKNTYAVEGLKENRFRSAISRGIKSAIPDATVM